MPHAAGFPDASRKKKSRSGIIPAFLFRKKNINDTPVLYERREQERNEVAENQTVAETEQEEITTQKAVVSKSSNEHSISALSLKSIRKKRELEAAISPVQINPEDLPKDHFTFEELKVHWDFCSEQYYKTGRMLMSSTMNMAQLELHDNNLIVEFPNTGSKLSFEENLYDLVSYIHKKLNNYHLKIEVRVNESVTVKKAYSIDDKLNYLKGLNPALEDLIKTFDLDLKP